MEIFLLFIAPVILLVLGLIIRSGKANFLIAGYNTASKEEKEKINEKELSKAMGNLLFILSGIQLILPIAKLLGIEDFNTLSICVTILFICATIGGVIYMNVGKKFKR